jgi:hypothetical protein
MVAENKLVEFVDRMRAAAGENLESVILFGSAVAGDFHPEFSNLNLFCVLHDSSFSSLQALAPVAQWWNRQKQPLPLLMTRQELTRSTDVFTIELMDMQQHHRVLFGDDVLKELHIPLDLHRVQVEYELREKLIVFRQQMLLASGDRRQLWDLLLRSAPSFVTLFRHALIALSGTVSGGKRDAVETLSKQVGFDPYAIYQVLDIRERKADSGRIDVNDLVARYLVAVQQVTDAVDRIIESDEQGRS